jgi:hypothetical protein
MKEIKFDQGNFEITLEKCQKQLEPIQALIELFNRLGLGKATDDVFNAVMAGEPERLSDAWSQKASKEVAKITTNPGLAGGFLKEINKPFEEWCVKVREIKAARSSAVYDSNKVEDSFLQFSDGRVTANEEAIREKYTLYMSEAGELLYEKALEVKKHLEDLQDFLTGGGHDPKLMQVLLDEQAFIPIIGQPWQPPEQLFTQNNGVIEINKEFFACV